MKTVEESESGLPSFETDWPKNLETKRESDASGGKWASERLNQMFRASVWENAWRGFRGYDSPLAG